MPDGLPKVRKQFSLIIAESAPGSCVMTRGWFTHEVVEFAICKPIDDGQLSNVAATASMSDQPKQEQGLDSIRQEPTRATTPTCPACKSEMTLRKANQGIREGRSL